MTYVIDLNCDLGESFGAFKVGQDEAVIPLITSANIACGYHAGDHNIMSKTVKLAKENQVAIGAHPGLYDLIGFGRRMIQLDPKDVYHLVVYQIGALASFTKIHGANLRHVKPHGALYNIAAEDIRIAQAIAEAVYDYDPTLILFALSGSKLVEAGRKLNLTVAEEVFADRTYLADGTLTPRTEPNSIIENNEKCLQQVLQMVIDQTVTTITGEEIPIQADTICVHGDSVCALNFVQYLNRELQKHHIRIQPFGDDHDKNC